MIVETAQLCIGTPFRHQGRKIGVGLDCPGVPFVCGVAAGADPAKDFRGYSFAWSGECLHERMVAFVGSVVPPEERMPGDVLGFWVRKRGVLAHFGVLVENNKIVHAIGRGPHDGCVVCHNLDERWRNRIKYVYRFVF